MTISALTANGSFLLFCLSHLWVIYTHVCPLRLHSRWESSPLPSDQPLGQNITCATSSAVTAVGSLLLFHLIHRLDKNITCATSSAVTAVGSFLLFRLINRWGCISLVQPHPLSQPLGVSSSSACSTVGLYKSRPCRFSVGASRHPVTPVATRRHCTWLAVDWLYTGRGSPFPRCSMQLSSQR